MYHTHPKKDEPSLSSPDDYLLYFDLSHNPRSIRHFYTVMKDRMDYFHITPKKNSKENFLKLSEDKIIDELDAEMTALRRSGIRKCRETATTTMTFVTVRTSQETSSSSSIRSMASISPSNTNATTR